MNARSPQRPTERPPVLTFAPLAWMKLQFFCHQGHTEIGGFGISAANDLLYIEEFHTVRQQVSAVSVRFDDAAVADFFDKCVDRGLPLTRFGRLWLHTHPGSSALPSMTDEETFGRVFGKCDWSVMFILGRTGNAYARLSLAAGPGAEVLLPVQVDWSAWPKVLVANQGTLDACYEQWRKEYETNIQAVCSSMALPSGVGGMKPFAEWWEDLSQWPGLAEVPGIVTEEDNQHEPSF